MDGLLKNVKNTVLDYKSELFMLKSKSLAVNKSVCNLDSIISSIQASSQTQEEKMESLHTFSQKSQQFITDAVCIDNNVAERIKQRKREFYTKFRYLKPECEKDWIEKAENWFASTGEWCTEHWKEIVSTLIIVIGAVLAVALVLCTGGLALVPLLATGLTAVGVSAATAVTIATGLSILVAVIAVTSTVVSSTLNIIDTWCEIEDPTFENWQNVMNWTSTISNGLYSIGNMYNSIKGVSGKEFIARKKAIENGKLGYGELSDAHPRVRVQEGNEYSSSQKNHIYEENMRRNGGTLRSDQDGKILVRYKSERGVPKPANGAEIDHILPKSKGGYNSYANARIVNWKTNLSKSNNLDFPLDLVVGGIKDVGNVWHAFGIGVGEAIRNAVNHRSEVTQ